MGFDNNVLFKDVMKVVKSSVNVTAFQLRLIILLPNEDVIVDHVLAVHSTRDMLNKAYESLTIDLLVGVGTWSSAIYPNKKNLKVKLEISPADHYNPSATKGAIHTQEYNATLLENKDSIMENGGNMTNNRSEADATQMVPVTFELIQDVTNATRKAQVSGWVIRTPLKTVLEGAMMSVGVKAIPNKQQYDTGDYSGVIGVDVSPLDNQRLYDHIYLKDGVTLPVIPSYLQKTVGLYKSGIATHFHKGIWYIYPPYDFSRFSQKQRRLIVANVPKDKMGGMTNTYNYQGEDLMMIATGEVKTKDNSELVQLNVGNAVRVVNASTVMNDFIQTSKNESTTDRNNNILEGALEQRDNGITNLRPACNHITDNLYHEMSLLKEGMVAQVILQWHNSNSSLLYPGMPVKFLYMKDSAVSTRYGTVVGCDESTTLIDGVNGNKTMHRNAVLKLLVERNA